MTVLRTTIRGGSDLHNSERTTNEKKETLRMSVETEQERELTVVSETTDVNTANKDGDGRRRYSGVRWSHHALQRWDERTPWTSVSPERAWTDSVHVQYALPYFRNPSLNTFPKEVRMYKCANCHPLFVREDDTIVTVLLLEAHVDDSAVRTYLHELSQQYQRGTLGWKTDCWGEDPSRIREAQEWEHSDE